MKNTQSSAQTKMKPFYCTKFVIAPFKGFRLLRECKKVMQECRNVLLLESIASIQNTICYLNDICFLKFPSF